MSAGVNIFCSHIKAVRFAACLAILLIASLRAYAADANGASVNGADLYKKAFSLYDALSPQEKSEIKLSATSPIPEPEAASLYVKVQPMVALARQARAASYVDWKLPKPSIYRPMPHLEAAQKLGQTIRWEASRKMSKDAGEAVADLAAVEAMGRNVADRNFISVLVCWGLHVIVLRDLSAGAAHISRNSDLTYIMDADLPVQLYRDGMRGEAMLLGSMENEYRNPVTRAKSVMLQYVADKKTNPDGIDADEVASEVDWIRQTEELMALSTNPTDPDFQKWWSSRKAKGTELKVRDLGETLGMLDGITKKLIGVEAFNKMFETGLAMVHGDAGALRMNVDPANGKPFSYTPTASGFTLGTNWSGYGITLSLRFPKAVEK